ncbi:MAG: response regulator transcription factor [Dehalococcoidia bacterium]|nr:response regulator transcription factor [Dehalococcoidia bacterium]
MAGLRGDGDEALRLTDSGLSRLRQGGGVLEIERAEQALAKLRGVSVMGTRPDDLSEREIEVLQHMAAGESNPQISEALFIAPATVASHVRSILAKTGTSNRVQASSWALRHRLLAEDAEN